MSSSHVSASYSNDEYAGTEEVVKYGEIHGIVVDSATLSLCYLPFLRLNLESKKYSFVDSVAAGRFSVVVPEGTYNVTVEFGWYMTKTMHGVEVSSTSKDSTLMFMFDSWTGSPDCLK